ncbi:MAG: aspartate aminotransferase family protein [Flavobacteriales bacterium]|jgi:4-aminobutyrate aminotransferase/(S)-3-amino-2-methylpropionate transaminase|nr:aspartate aminotransferase family protein [Flavobacteriales bacterium]MBK6891987.1 aspartate aminotransferase family protein [Flavobacteriales bacterium]MBK7246125.1 aspartate aminotransferase family protein [Flavobacteriales bacterium]QQS71829.1 MAG: aspartate aminotransferase family protein [Flavobacteriales bacterium]HQV39299.1 aspartate aminotransferase family protein [Flavobacteriales bacterium]
MTEEVTKSQELISRRKAAIPNGVGMFNHATAVKAEGAIITDADGRELIDFAGGIGVVNAGHCPPPVVKAIQEQAAKFLHVSFNVASYEPYIALCEKLNTILPHGKATKTMLVSTGAEAVENAVKIARQATGRQGVLCFTDAFHGRTLMAMTLTSKVGYKPNSGPFAPEVYRTQFPNFYRYGAGRSEAAFVKDELHRLHELSHNTVAPENLAAVIVEPVQGEGGFNVIPKEYLKGLRKWCDQHGILLILDEIQSGFGRTGAWSAFEQLGVMPDISTWAKSLGSGLPIAAVVGRAEVMDAAGPSSIGGTYIGSPVSCAAALATIKYMEEIDINAKGRHVGEVIRKRFEKMQAKHKCIGDVRGLGAMMAMEFVQDGDPQKPDADTCGKLMAACAKRDLIVINAGTEKNIIRVLCPLVISDELLKKGLDIMEEELAAIVG